MISGQMSPNWRGSYKCLTAKLFIGQIHLRGKLENGILIIVPFIFLDFCDYLQRSLIPLRIPEVNVKNPYSDEDRKCDEQHREEEILPEQGDGQGGRGDDLGQQEEEHSEGEQDGDTEGDLRSERY